MRRREFITLVGGAAAAWPLAGRAQSETMRRVGWLRLASDPGSLEDLAKLGWIDGSNLRIDLRVVAGEVDQMGA
jgi:putative ABC transport system substrate-binding protein